MLLEEEKKNMCDENDGRFCSLNKKFKNFRNVLLKGEW